MTTLWRRKTKLAAIAWVASCPSLVACSSSTMNNPGTDGGSTDAGGSGNTSGDGAGNTSGDPQTPPMGAANVQAWLAEGWYKTWHSEPAVHAARAPSVHVLFNRVFANAAANAADVDGGPAQWPAGVAFVKEIRMAMSDP